MKKIIYLLFVMSILFVQCKKNDKTEVVENVEEEVLVTFEVPLNGSKSDFNSILPFGQINWGNKNNVEYIYLTQDHYYGHYEGSAENYYSIGSFVRMDADVTEATDRLTFSCAMSSNVLYDGKKCLLYYFGNNGEGLEGTNVTNIYHQYSKSRLIGKSISFEKQTGNIEDLGDYHVASIPVVMKRKYSNGSEYYLEMQSLQNRMAVAMMDLEGVNKLEGNTLIPLSFTVVWDGEKFVESYEEVENGSIEFTGNPGKKSFVAFLPVCERNLAFESSRGKCFFEDCIDEDQVYVSQLGQGIDDSMPLEWVDD